MKETEERNLCLGIFLTCSVLGIVMSLPLALEKVDINSRYGFRSTITFADEASWYAINKVGGIALAVSFSISAFVSALLLYRYPVRHGHPLSALVIVIGLLVTQGIVNKYEKSWAQRAWEETTQRSE